MVACRIFVAAAWALARRYGDSPLVRRAIEAAAGREPVSAAAADMRADLDRMP